MTDNKGISRMFQDLRVFLDVIENSNANMINLTWGPAAKSRGEDEDIYFDNIQEEVEEIKKAVEAMRYKIRQIKTLPAKESKTALQKTGNETEKTDKVRCLYEVVTKIVDIMGVPLTVISLNGDVIVKKCRRKDDDFGQHFERSTNTIKKEVESFRRLIDETLKSAKSF